MANLTPIKIRLLGKDYTLRVAEEDELATLEMAEYLDKKLTTFKKAHPDELPINTMMLTKDNREQLISTGELTK